MQVTIYMHDLWLHIKIQLIHKMYWEQKLKVEHPAFDHYDPAQINSS